MRVLLALLLVVGLAGCGGGSSPAETADADPVAALKKIGAKIKRDEQGEVVEVVLPFSDITDSGLVQLKGLTKLERLYLGFCPKITDAGLLHLKGLANLHTLWLVQTQVTDGGLVHLKGLKLTSLTIPTQATTDLGLKHYLAALDTHTALNLARWRITDAGLVHLKGLSSLQKLNLLGTPITDAGLVHLNGLTNLQTLNFSFTKVTDAGVAELKKALPNCKILR